MAQTEKSDSDCPSAEIPAVQASPGCDDGVESVGAVVNPSNPLSSPVPSRSSSPSPSQEQVPSPSQEQVPSPSPLRSPSEENVASPSPSPSQESVTLPSDEDVVVETKTKVSLKGYVASMIENRVSEAELEVSRSSQRLSRRNVREGKDGADDHDKSDDHSVSMMVEEDSHFIRSLAISTSQLHQFVVERAQHVADTLQDVGRRQGRYMRFDRDDASRLVTSYFITERQLFRVRFFFLCMYFDMTMFCFCLSPLLYMTM